MRYIRRFYAKRAISAAHVALDEARASITDAFEDNQYRDWALIETSVLQRVTKASAFLDAAYASLRAPRPKKNRSLAS